MTPEKNSDYSLYVL